MNTQEIRQLNIEQVREDINKAFNEANKQKRVLKTIMNELQNELHDLRNNSNYMVIGWQNRAKPVRLEFIWEEYSRGYIKYRIIKQDYKGTWHSVDGVEVNGEGEFGLSIESIEGVKTVYDIANHIRDWYVENTYDTKAQADKVVKAINDEKAKETLEVDIARLEAELKAKKKLRNK